MADTLYRSRGLADLFDLLVSNPDAVDELEGIVGFIRFDDPVPERLPRP